MQGRWGSGAEGDRVGCLGCVLVTVIGSLVLLALLRSCS